MPRIEVFSSPQCGYCDRAKALLTEKSAAFIERDVAADEAHRQDLMARLPRSRSLPQIFIDGAHIGGYEDLCLLAESGRLDALIAPSGD